ncbi:hypothetical protein [Streptomyces sp. NPDC094437]|uniref:hypothetical protein n=1 Tax=Streptomyces sp. NPDC094437 TaxID=3366060 RepID=UPI0037FAC268
MGSMVAAGTLLSAAAIVGAVGSVALRYELSAPARATLPVPGPALDAGGSGLRIFPGRIGGLSTAGAVTVEPGRRRGLVASKPTLTFSTSQFLAR